MRILFVSRRVYPDSVGEGGSVSAFYIAKAVQSKGHEVHFLTFNPGGKPSREVVDGVVIHRMDRKILKYFPRFSNLEYMYFQMFFPLLRLVKRLKPDVIHALNVESIPACAFVAKILKKIPFFLTVNGLFWCFRGHCLDYNNEYCFKCKFFKLRKCVADRIGRKSFSVVNLLSWIYLYFHLLEFKYFTKKADGIFAISNAVKNCLVVNGFDKDKIFTVYNPLPARKEFKKCEELKLELVGKKKVILYVGRLSYSKGLDRVIRAMKHIDDAIFLVIGPKDSGKEISSNYSELFKLCEEEGVLDKVKFLGYVDNKELYKYYAIADVSILLGTYYEPFSRFLLESCGHGVPMVGANVGGNPEIVTDKTGIILKSFSSWEVADAVKKVISRKDKLSKGCLEQSKKYSLLNLGKEICKVYGVSNE